MTPLDITKKAATLIVGVGTSKIATAIIQNNISPDKLTDKVFVLGAGIVIGSMASDATKKYTGDKIDEIAHWCKTNIKTAHKN